MKGNRLQNSKMIFGLTLGLIVVGLSACAATTTPAAIISAGIEPAVTESVLLNEESVVEATNLLVVAQDGSTSVDTDALTTALSTTGVFALSESESAGLIFMREEEKLARDVYLTLYDQWGLNIFQNIASSEQTHTDAVSMLLDQYGLDDPVGDNPIGVFTNANLQALYDQLVALGSQSLEDALKVGAAIEEIDILDLEKNLVETDNPDIQLVYENLMQGSHNHLRAFTSTLERQTGVAYQPQYLSEEAYQAIVGAEMESGANRRGGGRGRGNSSGRG